MPPQEHPSTHSYPAPRSHRSGASSEVLEVADMIQGMIDSQHHEASRTASSWRSRCAPYLRQHSRLAAHLEYLSCATDLMRA